MFVAYRMHVAFFFTAGFEGPDPGETPTGGLSSGAVLS